MRAMQACSHQTCMHVLDFAGVIISASNPTKKEAGLPVSHVKASQGKAPLVRRESLVRARELRARTDDVPTDHCY